MEFFNIGLLVLNQIHINIDVTVVVLGCPININLTTFPINKKNRTLGVKGYTNDSTSNGRTPYHNKDTGRIRGPSV